MKTLLKIIWLPVLLSVLGSCTLYKPVPIDVLRTKEVSLTKENPGLAFIYRNFKFNKDTLQNYYLENGNLRTDRKTGRRETDSLVVSACLNSLATSLKNNGICETPVFYPYDIFPANSGERIIPLPADLVKKMALTAKADYLVVLETITYFFVKENQNPSNGGFQQVKIAGVWNLYNGSTGKITDHKSMTDTLYWDLNVRSDADAGSVVPPRLVSLQQAAGIFGENYGKRFYEEWETVNRMLIIPPLEDFRVAAEYAGKQKWGQAAEIWKKYSGKQYGRLAISACYNLALYSEIEDDFKGAQEWIASAVELSRPYKGSDEQEYALRYQEILKNRILGIENSRKKVTPGN